MKAVIINDKYVISSFTYILYTHGMSKVEFQVIYDGKALQNNEMDVRELAPALLAVGDLLEEANVTLYGEKSKVYVNVKGSFKTGSFHIDFTTAQSFLDGVADIFQTQPIPVQILVLLGIIKTATDGVEAITKVGDGVRVLGGGVLQFILWLKNRNIKKITKSDDGNVVIIEVEDGEKIATQNSIISLFRNIRIRSSFDTIVTKLLSKDGIDYFATGQGKELTEVKKEEKDYFITPATGEKIVEDQTIETTLQAITVSFEEGYKWRFTDGETSFTASVKDEGFINRIQDNKVAFAKGDALKVKLHKTVILSDKGLKPDYEILEIVEHFQVGKQIELPFEDKQI